MFPDPKVLDKWIFQDDQSPSDYYSRQEIIQMLTDMVIKNPKIYVKPEDIKIINQADYLHNLSNEAIFQKFNENFLFQTLLILGQYGGKDYVNLLIERNKPSLIALNTADQYRKFLLATS